jgi:hypothetical protein
MDSKLLNFTIIFSLCFNQIILQGYSFTDPTKSASSNGGARSSFAGYNNRFTPNQMRNNVGGQSGVGMPVSKYGNSSQQSGQKQLPFNNNQGRNNNVAQQNSSGGSSRVDFANDPNILRLVSSNPQIKNILQQALNSGDSNQLQNVLTLLRTFAGNMNGGGGGSGGNNSRNQGLRSQQKNNQVQHCSAPKYGGIMNAVKGINMSKLNQLKHNSSANISFVYYKKTEETNFTEYKLVFRFDENKKSNYVYSHFVISRTMASEPNFQNYLVTGNTTLLSQIINETDFSVNNNIKCIDLKIMFNGGLQRGISTSAFGGGGIAPQTFQGANPGFNPQQQQQGFRGFNQQIPQQQQFGGFNNAVQQPQQPRFGYNPMQQQQFGGQQSFGYNGAQNQQMGGQGLGYRPPAMGGGFGGQVPQNSNSGGTFMINQN